MIFVNIKFLRRHAEHTSPSRMKSSLVFTLLKRYRVGKTLRGIQAGIGPNQMLEGRRGLDSRRERLKVPQVAEGA